MKVLKYFFLLTAIMFWFNDITAQELSVTNVNYTLVDGKIQISYDLNGEQQKEYEVSAFLRRETVPKFEVELKSAGGDIGKGQFAGKDKVIVWNFENDFKLDYSIEDYYFEIRVDKLGGGIAWYYYVGAAVGGAVVAVLTMMKGDDGGGNTTTTEVTQPPARP
mgnify:FL=1